MANSTTDGNSTGGQRQIQPGNARIRAGFTPVSNLVVRSRKLSGNAKAMYAIMLDVIEWQGKEPDLLDLGQLLGGGEKTARSALQELRAVGLVTSKRRGRGLPNAYYVHEPEIENGPEGGSRTAPGAAPHARTYFSLEDELQDAPTEGKPSVGGTRKPRVVFDAIARSTNANPAAAAGEIAKAEKAIRAAEADTIAKNVTRYLIENPQVDEVPTGSIELWLVARVEQRAARYREMRPTWELTPSSLAKHWLRIPTWTHDRGDRGGLSASELMEVDLG